MRQKARLESRIKAGEYKREDQMMIIERDQEMIPGKYCTARREDILCYVCFDAASIQRDAIARRTLSDYLETKLGGFDSPDMYADAIAQICDKLRVGNLESVADRLLSDKSLDAVMLYEKKGHYFTSDDGAGFDVTRFVEENLPNMVGIRDGKKGGYRLYIIFFDGGKNGK